MSSIYNTLQQNFIIIIERLLYSRKLLLQDDRVIIVVTIAIFIENKELKSTAQKSSLYNYLHWHSGEKSLKKSHFSTFKIKLTIDEFGALGFKWKKVK